METTQQTDDASTVIEGEIVNTVVEDFDPFADEKLKPEIDFKKLNEENKEAKRQQRGKRFATAVERTEEAVSGQLQMKDRRRISEIIPDVPVYKCEDIEDQDFWLHNLERRTGKYGDFLVGSIELDQPEEGQEPGILLIGGTVLQDKLQKLWNEINEGKAFYPVLCMISKKSGAEYDYWDIS